MRRFEQQKPYWYNPASGNSFHMPPLCGPRRQRPMHHSLDHRQHKAKTTKTKKGHLFFLDHI